MFCFYLELYLTQTFYTTFIVVILSCVKIKEINYLFYLSLLLLLLLNNLVYDFRFTKKVYSILKMMCLCLIFHWIFLNQS